MKPAAHIERTTRRLRSTSIVCVHVAATFALLATAGCCPRPQPPSHDPACAPPSTDREIFLGLYSIYYRAAHLPATGAELGRWAPVSLATAVRSLSCDPDRDRRRYRVRSAAIKLATSVVILQRHFPHSAALAAYIRALEGLGKFGPLAEQLADSSAQTPGDLEDAAGTIIDAKPDDDPLAALQRSCCPCLGSCKSGTASGGVAAVEFTIHVNREAPCLVPVVDPQCWKTVVPLHFNADPQVVAGPACMTATPPTPTCRNNDTCNDPLLPAPAPLAMPPTPGTPWCGLLFEDVALAGAGIVADTKNVLGVRTTLTTTPDYSYRMDYNLCESRQWSVTSGTPSSGTCSIELDCGYVAAEDTGVTGNANLYGTKRIRFASTFEDGANDWAPIALEVLATETATAACVPSAGCAAAKPPATCASASPGSTAETEPCTCDKSPDHCDGPTDPFTPTFDAPLCP